MIQVKNAIQASMEDLGKMEEAEEIVIQALYNFLPDDWRSVGIMEHILEEARRKLEECKVVI